jgi:hypothetical protein
VWGSDDLAGAAVTVGSILAAIDDLPDGNANVLVGLADMRLRCFAPTTIKQDVCGLHACGRRVFLLAHDRGQVADALRRIRPAQ